MQSTTFNTKLLSILRSFILLGILAGYTNSAFADAPKREFTKTVNREFGTIANGMTALYNKYGKVNVNTWQNNSVKIDITIVVNARDQRGADKMFDRIKFNFANTAGYVKAETMIEQGNDWWLSEYTCQDFQINYEVYMPIGNQLDLKNRYGNAYVGNLNNKLTAEIKYGDLRTESINADADLNIAYGKANMVKVQNLFGSISYGSISVTDARDIQLDSKYSALTTNQAGIVRVTSKYDEFDLGTISELRLQTKYSGLKLRKARAVFVTGQYTDLVINNVTDVLDADLMYGNLTLGALSKGFSSVKINAKYTDVVVTTERSAAFRFVVAGSYTDLRYPATATIQQKDDSGHQETLHGYVGDVNAKGMMKATLNYGDFVLK
ncbi:MAG: hypothetical protein ACOYPR_09170 [Saprospiraceae bacterium]